MTNYNIGAGAFSHPLWVNVDLPSEHYAGVQGTDFIAHDLMSLGELPIGTRSADLVYCSHVIEHVTDDAVAKLLSEAHRILKPGGGLRLVTPCIELAYRNWRRGDREFFGPKLVDVGTGKPPLDASVTQLWLHHFASQLAEIDSDATAVRKFSDAEVRGLFDELPFTLALDHFMLFARFNHQRPENHVNWFSYDKLARMVRDAGFADVYRSGAGQSCFPQMRDVRVFDPHFGISLFVEAVKT